MVLAWLEVASLAHSGLCTNLWGRGCPFYCSWTAGNLVAPSILGFISGTIFGASLVWCIFVARVEAAELAASRPSSERGTWDLWVEIEGLSIRRRRARVRVAASPDELRQQGSPTSSLASFFLVSEPQHLAASSTVPAAQTPAPRALPRACAASAGQVVFQASPSVASTPCCARIPVKDLHCPSRNLLTHVSRGKVDRFCLNLSSRYYALLGVEGLENPAVVCSLATFRRIVGLDLDSSITHSFPVMSESECRVYFLAAGVTYPRS